MPVHAENIKKVAVTMDGQQAQLLPLNQAEPLESIIEFICQTWNLANPSDYAMRSTEPNRECFITESNRMDIQNGNVLDLSFSPAKITENIMSKLQDMIGTSIQERSRAIEQTASLASDITFAQEFINQQGINLFIKIIEDETYMNMSEVHAYTLKAFYEIMTHGIVSWDIVEAKFIRVIASNIKLGGPLHASTLQAALEILETIVLNNSTKYSQVEQEVTPVNLLPFLQSSNSDIRKNAIALINALFLKADSQKRKKIADDLQSKSIRNVILEHIIRGSINLGPEMCHQLHVLQRLLFNLLDDRRQTSVEPNDQDVQKGIAELRRIVFDMEATATPPGKKQNYVKDYKKLGFQNYANPVEDFKRVPPGLLGLDVMQYFARFHGTDYTKLVLENSGREDEHDLPYAQASIELTNLLCDILNVGEPPSDEGIAFNPMFFNHDHPFEEFYSICIQLFNKTWKAMKATSADLAKVLSVVKEQITRAMERRPPSFEQFKIILSRLTYTEITKIWEQERRDREEGESQAKPILELREQIKPEMMELIKQQRLNFLVEGTRFTKYQKGARVKDKYRYCRLAPNHKSFHYGDCGEADTPSIEQLPCKLAVVDIKGLLTGKECSHIKERRGQKAPLAFAIQTEPDVAEPLAFVAPKEEDFDMWTDGVNALLSNQMESERTKQDLDTLLSMEIKLRLLDTEGIRIPEEAPPIPPEPPNYDFAYK